MFFISSRLVVSATWRLLHYLTSHYVNFSDSEPTPYKINNFELQISSTVRDLGVLLSSDLTFNAYIDATYSKQGY